MSVRRIVARLPCVRDVLPQPGNGPLQVNAPQAESKRWVFRKQLQSRQEPLFYSRVLGASEGCQIDLLLFGFIGLSLYGSADLLP